MAEVAAVTAVAIRVAVASDAAAIAALARDSAAVGQWTEAQYMEAIGSFEEFVTRRVWVAETDGCVVGFLAAMHVEGEGATELENILVSPALRRRGVAASLCDAFQQWTEEQGAEAMTLEARESNATAIGFYARLGYVAEGKRKDYYKNPAEDAVMMRRELTRMG